MSMYLDAARSMLRRHPADAALPDVIEARPQVHIDPDHLAAYAHVCGFTLTNTLPPTYPQVLAFPLAMAVMTGPDFPLPVVGSVHIEEEITASRAPTVDDVLDLVVRPENLRAHRRGRQFDMITTASVDGVEIWRSRSTYLRRESTTHRTSTEPATSTEPVTSRQDPIATTPSATWRLPGDLGRRYGSVSGDRNPIHLYPLTARLFGFRRPIAHGMWTLAATLATVQNRLGAAYRVQARFARPVLLPSTVDLATGTTTDPDGDVHHRLELTDSRQRPHLTVDVTS